MNSERRVRSFATLATDFSDESMQLLLNSLYVDFFILLTKRLEYRKDKRKFDKSRNNLKTEIFSLIIVSHNF
jgi:hypothetical protein